MSVMILDKNIDRLSQGKYVELTDILVELPYQIGILDGLGLFEEQYTSLRKIEIQRSQYSNHLLKDKNWDAQADTQVVRPVKGFIQAKIPNFALQDAIKPMDIEGVASVNDILEAAQLETVMDVRIEKLAHINNTFDNTMEVAKMQLLKKGTVYAPSGTLATSYGDTIDFYQEMGVTRQTHQLMLTGANDPRKSVGDLVRKMRLSLRNTPTRGNYRDLIVLCGRDLFDAVYMNPFVTEAVKYFQQDLNKLLLKTPDGANGLSGNYRSVSLWGVTFIDASLGGYDDADGNFVQWIDDDKGIAVPTGVRGMFKTYYAPAMTFSSVNKKSKGRYYFERLNDEDNLIQMKVEHNFMNALLFPASVFDITFA